MRLSVIIPINYIKATDQRGNKHQKVSGVFFLPMKWLSCLGLPPPKTKLALIFYSHNSHLLKSLQSSPQTFFFSSIDSVIHYVLVPWHCCRKCGAWPITKKREHNAVRTWQLKYQMLFLLLLILIQCKNKGVRGINGIVIQHQAYCTRYWWWR